MRLSPIAVVTCSWIYPLLIFFRWLSDSSPSCPTVFLRLTSQINLILESLFLSLPLGGNENLQYPTEHPKMNPFSLHPLLSTLVQGTVLSCLHCCKTFLTDLPGSSLGLLESAFHTQATICCYAHFLFLIERSGNCSLCNPSCSSFRVCESLRGLLPFVEAHLLSLGLL